MKPNSQFLVPKPHPHAGYRLFCFPHAGGGPVSFFEWTRKLDSDIECVCLQYAGRGQRLREEPHTSVEALVKEISAEFGEWQDKPFAFYGHSFGGTVAFELARQLRRSAMPGPSQLFVGAARPPHLAVPFSPIHQLPNEGFVENIQARYGGIPEAILRDRDVLEMFLPCMRADFMAYETYKIRPDAPLDIPITAFGGAEDTAVKPECLNEWARHTSGIFERNVLAGGNFFPPASIRRLLRIVKDRMAAYGPSRSAMVAV